MLADKSEVLVYLRKAAVNISDADEALLDLIHPLSESAILAYLQNDLEYQVHTEYLPVGTWQQEREYPLSEFRKQGSRFVYDGDLGAGQALFLKHKPVALTGLRVWEDIGANAGQASSAFGSDTELTLGTDFYLDLEGSSNLSQTGILYRIGVWPVEQRTVKVQYYGGYSAEQLSGPRAGALKLAVLEQVAFDFSCATKNYASRGTDGVKIREKIGKYECELDSGVAAYIAGIAGRDLLPRVRDRLQTFRSYRYL